MLNAENVGKMPEALPPSSLSVDNLPPIGGPVADEPAPEADDSGTDEAGATLEQAGEPIDKQRPRYATIQNPSVEAIVNGLYRLPDEAQAKKRLEQLRSYFTVSRESPDNAVVLWIKGYDVTDEEDAKGYLGNYALVFIEKTADKKFTLKTKKLESEPAYHPQRKRKRERHPNWGHPLMRQVKKARRFSTVDDARGVLMKLHEEYPEVTIPTLNKLYVMVYTRAPDEKATIQKFVLEIKPQKDGGYLIDAQQNNYKAAPIPRGPVRTANR